MLGLGQTQLCQWISCSKCLSYYDVFSPKGWAYDKGLAHIKESIQQTFMKYLHMRGVLPSPSDTDEQRSHIHKELIGK